MKFGYFTLSGKQPRSLEIANEINRYGVGR